MKWPVLVLAVAACLATCTLLTADGKQAAPGKPAQAKPTPAPLPAGPVPGDTQDLVYFGAARPLLLRLHVQIDGKSYRSAWEDAVAYVFKALDLNGDGVLRKEEIEKAPSVEYLFNSNLVYNGVNAAVMSQMDQNHDGKVTLDEFLFYCRKRGGGAFQFQFGQGETIYQDPFGGAQVPVTGPLNDALFGYLDTNKDGKLSRAELAAMPATLLALDADEDEMVTVQELLPSLMQSGNRRAGIRPTPRSSAGNAFFLVDTDAVTTGLSRQLLDRYGSRGGQRLTRKELGLDQNAFDDLDLDRNGDLDAKELERFNRRPADLELIVRFGRSGRRELLEWIPRKSGLDPLAKSIQKPPRGESIALDLMTTRLELRRSPGSAYGVSLPNLRQIYSQQFKAADRDNNGYLDAKEAQQSGFFVRSFRMMDANGDGRLYEKEMLAFLDKLYDWHRRASASCASLTASDQGRGLFDFIDTNRDGRLSIREMRNAQQLIDQLDRDGDGLLSKSEIPHNFLVSIAQGLNSNNQNGNMLVFTYGMQSSPLPPLMAGPLWFRKMDRNRDGDVSRREFLGTDEEFQRIDTDGDGLISAQEADTADQAFRRQSAQGR
jgi:Ca2+-binding EF-hand superfamily protein